MLAGFSSPVPGGRMCPITVVHGALVGDDEADTDVTTCTCCRVCAVEAIPSTLVRYRSRR